MTRRVVTGHQDGTSVFCFDGAPPKHHEFKTTPGLAASLLWTTTAGAPVPFDRQLDTVDATTSSVPPEGGTALMILKIPPDSVRAEPGFDGAAAGAEFMQTIPEIAVTQEPDSPGMHRTETIDYVIVLDGEIYLELDDGQEVLLLQHDVVVQNATRHAWRNRSDRVTTLAVVLVGARRG